MHAFWLVLTYDPLEDRRIDDIIIKTFFNSLLYKTNRFQVALRLFSNRSQRTSKCGKNISDTLGCASCADFFCYYHILTSSVIYYWTDAWQLGIYLLSCSYNFPLNDHPPNSCTPTIIQLWRKFCVFWYLGDWNKFGETDLLLWNNW